MKTEAISVSEFNALINQTLAFAYPEIVVEGEVANFKLNQNKWVFFDLKDESSLVSCFIPIFQLKTELEDGMKVRVSASVQLTKWGKFSLTVREVELAGEGSVKRAFELLKKKLELEGLFAPERKRLIPDFPQRVLLITSKQAAAFNDFVSIAYDRWQGVEIDHLQVQVQGETAPAQIVKAFDWANEHAEQYDVLVLIRGGGSPEDMQAFSTEEVTRAVFGCKLPSVVAIGHEDDVCLAELAADLRAATPSDAARRLFADKKEVLSRLSSYRSAMTASLNAKISVDRSLLSRYYHSLEMRIAAMRQHNADIQRRSEAATKQLFTRHRLGFFQLKQRLNDLDPQAILARGYSIARINGKVLKSAQGVGVEDTVMLQLHQGSLMLKKSEDQNNDQEQIKIGF